MFRRLQVLWVLTRFISPIFRHLQSTSPRLSWSFDIHFRAKEGASGARFIPFQGRHLKQVKEITAEKCLFGPTIDCRSLAEDSHAENYTETSEAGGGKSHPRINLSQELSKLFTETLWGKELFRLQSFRGSLTAGLKSYWHIGNSVSMKVFAHCSDTTWWEFHMIPVERKKQHDLLLVAKHGPTLQYAKSHS